MVRNEAELQLAIDLLVAALTSPHRMALGPELRLYFQGSLDALWWMQNHRNDGAFERQMNEAIKVIDTSATEAQEASPARAI